MNQITEEGLLNMLVALKKVGFSQQAIAEALHVNQSTISRLLSRQVQPKWQVAICIEKLYLQHCQSLENYNKT